MYTIILFNSYGIQQQFHYNKYMRSLRKILLSLSLALLIFGIPSVVFASPPPVEPAPKLCHLEGIIQSLIEIALAAGGLALFIMILIGGFKWLTAGANDKAVAEARGTITWAVIGLVIMLASFFILQFIFNFTKVDVTGFDMPWAGDTTLRPTDCP